VIKNEKVTQSGIHHFRNPTKSGIELQVQKGVIAQNTEDNRYSSQKSFFLLRKFLTFSIGKITFTMLIT
jgi:hypothetical protein